MDDKNLVRHGFIGKEKLKNKFSKEQAEEILNKEKENRELFAKPKKRKLLKITGNPYDYNIDIMVLPEYNKKKFLLFLVNISSRMSYGYILKQRKMEDIIEQYKIFLQDVNNFVDKLFGDDEFSAQKFKDFNNELNIEVITDVAADEHITKGSNKMGLIDRATKTIKDLLEKVLTHYDQAD